jgi:hypothetical protein
MALKLILLQLFLNISFAFSTFVEDGLLKNINIEINGDIVPSVGCRDFLEKLEVRNLMPQ